MDTESLRTASEYLNNLLLARGLLRNGTPVDFVKPSRESRAQIINLVHDLILRGDRDKENRERTILAYRQLRADDDSKNNEIDRLKVKNADSTRAVAQAQVAERVARDETRKIERSMRTLQEQGAKLKAALAQVKTQCTNDVKRRDLELARLKTHLQGQQRGSRSTSVAPSISITGTRKAAFDSSVRDVADPAYSLKQESNEFLTQLSQNLSDENDRLTNIVRGAVLTLRELLGLQSAMRGASDSGIGEDVTTARNGDKIQEINSFDILASDLESTLTHLKSLLTNPNFVSIEEVEVREEEIMRIRADWEKMEQRWSDLLAMMTGWRKRMDTGGMINKDDLRRGMGLVSPSHEQSEPTIAIPVEPDNSLVDDSIDEIRRSSLSRREHGVINEGRASPKRKRDANESTSRSTVLPDNPQKRSRNPLEPPESFDLRPRSTMQQTRISRVASSGADGHRPSTWAADDGDESEELEVPRMTIEEKLSAVAEEAAAARQDRSSTCLAATSDGAADELMHDEDALGTTFAGVKKTRILGKPRRRKSTLSRDELAELLAAAD